MDIDESDARLESDENAVKILTIHKSKENFLLPLFHFVGKQKEVLPKKRFSKKI